MDLKLNCKQNLFKRFGKYCLILFVYLKLDVHPKNIEMMPNRIIYVILFSDKYRAYKKLLVIDSQKNLLSIIERN